MNAEQFAKVAESLGVSMSADQISAFEEFEQALYRANEVMNLTRVPRDECWLRHFIDSLLIQSLIPPGSRVLDIGTGPGFPAWPLACARPDLSIMAMDSNGKMVGFLENHLLPNLKTVRRRAEEWETPTQFDFVTGRALAPLPIQVEVSTRYCKIGGLLVPMRTKSDGDLAVRLKVGPLGLAFDRSVEMPLPGTDAVRLFPIYRKIRPAIGKYPRPWADITKSPIS